MPSASAAASIGTDAWRAHLRTIRNLDKIVSDILLDASKEAFRVISALDGLDSVSARVRRAQYQQAVASLARISGQAWSAISPELADHARQAAAQGVAGASALDRLLAETVVDDNLRASLLASIDRADALITARIANNIKLSQKVYRTQALAQGWVEREVNRGIALGRSAREIANSVRSMINPNVRGGVNYAAMRLARTELNNAFHTATIARAEDDPWTKGFKWNKSSSHPRPDPCDDLADDDHDGLGPGVFKPKNVPGKPHPQCLCYLTIIQVDEDEFIDKLIAGEYDQHIEKRSGMPVDDGPKVVQLDRQQLRDRVEAIKDVDRLTPEGEREFFRISDDFNESLTKEQFEAINAYEGSGYTAINAQLRFGTPAPGRFGDAVNVLTSPSMPRVATPYDKLYRGIDDELNLSPGDRFKDKGFTSTTPSPQSALEFMNGRMGANSSTNRTLFVIDTSKMKSKKLGMPGNRSEIEWVLPTNSSFSVGSIEEYTTPNGGVHRIINLVWDGVDG